MAHPPKPPTAEDMHAFETAMQDVTPLAPRTGSRLPGKGPDRGGPADPGAADRRPVDAKEFRALEHRLSRTRAALHAARAEVLSVKEERDEWAHRAQSLEGMRATLQIELAHTMHTQPATVPLVDLLLRAGLSTLEGQAERVLDLLLTADREVLLSSLRITAEGFAAWERALTTPPAEPDPS